MDTLHRRWKQKHSVRKAALPDMMMIGVLGRVDFNGHFAPSTARQRTEEPTKQ